MGSPLGTSPWRRRPSSSRGWRAPVWRCHSPGREGDYRPRSVRGAGAPRRRLERRSRDGRDLDRAEGRRRLGRRPRGQSPLARVEGTTAGGLRLRGLRARGRAAGGERDARGRLHRLGARRPRGARPAVHARRAIEAARGLVLRALVKLRFGFTPCPNDAFAFHALVHGLVPASFEVEPVLLDIEELNQRAAVGELELSKLSFGAAAAAGDRYRLLRSGAALGRGVGPLVVARQAGTLEEAAARRVAVP